MPSYLRYIAVPLACLILACAGSSGEVEDNSGDDAHTGAEEPVADDAGSGGSADTDADADADAQQDPMQAFYETCRCECACQGTPPEPDQCPRNLARCGCGEPCPPGIP